MKVIFVQILVRSLQCFEQSGNDGSKIKTCNSNTKYCVYKQIAQNSMTVDRGCATNDDMDFKKFHEIEDMYFDEECKCIR